MILLTIGPYFRYRITPDLRLGGFAWVLLPLEGGAKSHILQADPG